jgi:hypothetical protein
LKAETDAEARSVFFEESAGLLDIFLSVRLKDVHYRIYKILQDEQDLSCPSCEII